MENEKTAPKKSTQPTTDPVELSEDNLGHVQGGTGTLPLSRKSAGPASGKNDKIATMTAEMYVEDITWEDGKMV